MFFDTLIVSLVSLLFPIALYLIYLAYRNNLNLKEQKLILAVSLVSSMYLIIKFKDNNAIHYLLLINIPLLISFLKKRRYVSIILSIIISLYYYFEFDLNIYLIVFEYIIYYVTYYFLIKEKLTSALVINSFVLLKGVILSLEICYLLDCNNSFFQLFFQTLLLLIVFYALAFIILNLLEKGEQIINLNSILKELEKEKIIHSSLFKITHEIKNPISVCRGYLNMMDYQNIEKVEKYNNIIKNELDRTLTIMDDFLDYTKIKVNKDIMDVTMLIEDTTQSIDSLLKHYNVNLKTDISEDEIFIDGDYNRLKQVLINIFKNSIESIKKDGLINVSLESDDNFVTITVEDNGEGMDSETLNNIMQPFFTTKPKGTGLGTCLSKEIIDSHNGTIKYESEKNKGTKVLISLPLKN